jgi:hypothetical protein
MKIGNIIYEKELVNHETVDYINYYDSRKDLSTVNWDLPTLVVGWSYMMNSFKENDLIQKANILTHRIKSNELYWEFSFDENKSSHVSGVRSFINNIYDFYFSRFKYINLDPIFFQINDVNELMDILPKELDCFYQYKRDMIYILKEKQIWGLNLDIYTFFKFDLNLMQERLEDRIIKQSHIDEDGYLYMNYSKKYPNFEKLKRYLIVMFNNKNVENEN